MIELNYLLFFIILALVGVVVYLQGVVIPDLKRRIPEQLSGESKPEKPFSPAVVQQYRKDLAEQVIAFYRFTKTSSGEISDEKNLVDVIRAYFLPEIKSEVKSGD